MTDIEKIKSLIKQQQFEEAQNLLKKIADTNLLSKPENVENLFSVLISANPILRFFLKHLEIQKVPETPIDTSFDTGRRFFYALYIINRFGGKRFVTPYIKDIKINRSMEYRFLGGIHYFNMDYEKARDAYQHALELITQDEFDEFKHLFIYGNLAVCSLYLNDIDSYNQLKSIALSQTNSHPSMIRIFEKYDVFMHIHNGDNSAALSQYEKCKELGHYQSTINSNEETYLNTYIAAIGEDLDDFREKLKLMMTRFKTDIQNGNFTPERLIGTIFYISTITKHSKKGWQDIIDLDSLTYPFVDIKIRDKVFTSKKFASMGENTAKNFINYTTEEYEVNGIKGIGLSNELKAIYWIVRSHEFGISVETLASLIYSHEDFAGLFLIRERIKQIVNRLIKHYKIKLKISIYRVYIEPEEVKKFYLVKDAPYKIPDNFSIYDLMDFYQISNTKAQKIINNLLEKNVITKNKSGKKNLYTFI